MKVRQGDLSASVMLDTLPKEHLFAIGPEEDLRSEIFVWEGRIFRAGVMADTKQPYVEKDVEGMKAVFLVWANVSVWDTLVLRPPIANLSDLEEAIGKAAHEHGTDTSRAFPFLLFGKLSTAKGHIMDKDPALTDITPAVAEGARRYYPIEGQKAQMVGFYSHHHQRIFTHHDSFIHIHYRLYSKYHAGHLDEAAFDAAEPLRLLLPKK
ncbi:MAG TPA: hypothetical protein VK907_06745 [Phnomibacter sp.]|nr:hypothetical protein [Phnomibacter sp.]